MRGVRILLWVLVALALIGAGWLLVRQSDPQSGKPPTSPGNLGGPFTLTGVDGRPFASSRLAGKPYAMFFGFTHCPDVCPTTLARLVRLRRELGPGDGPFAIVFITVDPERDRPRELGAYVSLFGEPVVGLTGTPAQIERVKRQFGIFSEKVPDGSGGYTVDHSAAVLLFDRNGQFIATISLEENDAVALAKLKRISSA